jgi:cobalt-zinc-cadmium efflux system membrane fusion protein
LRLYAYEKDKPVDPAGIEARVILSRLGAPPEQIPFRKEGEFLRGGREVAEPHSFAVEVIAQRAGREHRWKYEQEEGRMRMSDAQAKGAGIQVAAASGARIRSTLQLQGEIQFNQDRLVRVVPRLAGVVTGVAKNAGDRVRRGEVLAVLESQGLGDLRSEYLAAQRRAELARTTHDRQQRLAEQEITSQKEYLAARQALAEAEIARRNAAQRLAALGLKAQSGEGGLSRLTLVAPIDGVVIEKKVATGEAVQADANIFVVADIATVWAEMTLYPADLKAVRTGQQATVRSADLGLEAKGSISYIGALLGDQTRTAKARVTLPNPDGRWRPGLFVTIDVVREEADVPVAVPVEAIQTLRGWKVVFGRFGDQFEARPVELGRSDGKQVEIVRGLAPGQQYAAGNAFVLKAELGKAGASHDH